MQTCGILWVKLQENGCLFKNVHNFLKNCPQAMLACLRIFPCLGQDMSRQARTGTERSGQVTKGQVRSGQVRTALTSSGWDRTGQEKSGRVRSGLAKKSILSTRNQTLKSSCQKEPFRKSKSAHIIQNFDHDT